MSMGQDYNIGELKDYVSNLENELMQSRANGVQANAQLSQLGSVMFDKEENQNLVKWQLDIQEELERIEHLLRGHIPGYDDKGNGVWKESPIEEQVFNDRGVREILKILTWYLNKNFILSNFSEEQIDQRVLQFSYALTDFIFLNYEDFGLNTPEKMKHYPMIIMNIVNTVEAAYNRALHGGERESLRTARTVNQTEPLGNFQNFSSMQGSNKNKFSIFRPTTWGR